MTDAQQYVLAHWPNATCHFVNLYWPGQGERKRWIVTRSPSWSGVDGEGLTEVEAWARAANRLEQKLCKEKGQRVMNKNGVDWDSELEYIKQVDAKAATESKAAPSITSARIAQIADEPTPCFTYPSATRYRIEKALREAGVRIGE